MIGVILAGGLGTRMGYYTHRVTNKHLCYVYNRAMIEYPLASLVEAGITDVVVVTGGRHSGAMLDYLGDGKEFGLDSLHYARQQGEGGIAHALNCAKPYVADGESVCVILGDNLFEDSLRGFVSNFEIGAKILLKEVDDPRSFGVATVQGKNVVKVVEKPANPESNFAVVGAYIFDSDVFSIIKHLKPSNRGELEVTDIIQAYLEEGILEFTKLEKHWTDMGSPESLMKAAQFIHDHPEVFQDRFSLFNVDLSLPISRSKALLMMAQIDGCCKDAAKAQLASHVNLLEKWSIK